MLGNSFWLFCISKGKFSFKSYAAKGLKGRKYNQSFPFLTLLDEPNCEISKLGWFSLHIKIVSSITFAKSELQKAIVQTASCFKAVRQPSLQKASV